MNIIEALKSLDPLDDDQWTADGSPRMDKLQELTGDTELSRKNVVDAAPDFDREAAKSPENLLMNKPENKEQSEEQSDPKAINEFIEQNPTGKELYEFLQTVPNKAIRDEVIPALTENLFQVQEVAKNTKQGIIQIKQLLHTANKYADEVDPNNSNSEAIREYIQAQNQARAERIAKSTKILENLDVKDLNGKSPLDQAMAQRKPTRGSTRPIRA